jgi:hypothetical protein
MLKKAIERWRLSKAIEVGHRFQTRYHSHRRRREQGQTSNRIVANLQTLPSSGSAPCSPRAALHVWS